MDVSDQPVYALSKEVQLRYPSRFGRCQYVCLLGDLHIEHTNLLINGELIKGSGLEVILEHLQLWMVMISKEHDIVCKIYNAQRSTPEEYGQLEYARLAC